VLSVVFLAAPVVFSVVFLVACVAVEAVFLRLGRIAPCSTSPRHRNPMLTSVVLSQGR
jgi:hypothetical protein